MSKRIANIVCCLCSLTLGGVLYILFRPNTYIAQMVSCVLPISDLQDLAKPFSCDFLMYYFPDFLWCFSLSCGIVAIFEQKYIIVSCAVSVFCGSVWEVLQYAYIIGGTGDIIDIIMYLAAGAIAVIINYSKGEKE